MEMCKNGEQNAYSSDRGIIVANSHPVVIIAGLLQINKLKRNGQSHHRRLRKLQRLGRLTKAAGLASWQAD